MSHPTNYTAKQLRLMQAVRDRYPRRAVKKTLSDSLKDLQIISGPFYTWADDTDAGGCKSWVTLGPGAVSLAMGSDADSELPKGITAVRAKYPQYSFKAGHILNAEFGGDGQDARNLTALTASANSANRKFDQAVKKALGTLNSFYEYVHTHSSNVASLEVGVTVTVTTTGAYWGSTAPDMYITTGLNCSAEMYSLPDLDEFLTMDSHKNFAGGFINEAIKYVRAANAAGYVANVR